MAKEYYCTIPGAYNQFRHYYVNTGASTWMMLVSIAVEKNDSKKLLEVYSKYREIIQKMKTPHQIMQERCLDEDAEKFEQELAKIHAVYSKFNQQSLKILPRLEKLSIEPQKNAAKIEELSEKIHGYFDKVIISFELLIKK